LPEFQKIKANNQDFEMVVIKRVENLENYLKELLDKPIYLHKKVLEFLNIEE